jgi:hypothetical protein
MPNVLFYAYSKSIPYFKKYYSGDDSAVFPTANFIITFSEGGKFDKDLENLDVKVSKVFKSPEEVLAAGLKVDLDDELAKVSGGRDSSFALLIHGTQAAGLNARMKLRNETFLAYWKYRPYLNSVFNKPDENVWGSVESIPIIQSIQDELKERSLGKRTKNSSIKLENIKTWLKLLRYVVKYENYNFSPELIEIIPDYYNLGDFSNNQGFTLRNKKTNEAISLGATTALGDFDEEIYDSSRLTLKDIRTKVYPLTEDARYKDWVIKYDALRTAKKRISDLTKPVVESGFGKPVDFDFPEK